MLLWFYMYMYMYLCVFIHVLYIARLAVVKISGLPSLCKTDEVGDICVQTSASGSSYWGLQGKSTHTFKVWYVHCVSIVESLLVHFMYMYNICVHDMYNVSVHLNA